MRRVIQVALVVVFVVAATYALIVIGIFILASVVSCACAPTPSPPAAVTAPS